MKTILDSASAVVLLSVRLYAQEYMHGHSMGSAVMAEIQDMVKWGWNSPRIHHRQSTEKAKKGELFSDPEWYQTTEVRVTQLACKCYFDDLIGT